MSVLGFYGWEFDWPTLQSASRMLLVGLWKCFRAGVCEVDATIGVRARRDEFLAADSDVDVRQDCLRLEDYLVMIGADVARFHLFCEISDVVTDPEEVLEVGVLPGLTGDFQLVVLVILFDRAATFNREDVLVRNAVQEYDASDDLERVCRLRDVLGCDVGVGAGSERS
jgi:hypothetical protein